MVELLVWPALVGYGEAAVALVGETWRPGLAGRLAIWGVRIGWLAQTGLLVAQAVRADGFPWSSWAGALNLLSWLVVGAYLIWGCRPRYRLLGLAVMPIAVVLLALAYAGGGVGSGGDHPGILLGLHVAFMLAAFAGFTVAAGLAGLYVWHERRLKRREARILRLRVPALDTLERLSMRTAAVSLGVLTVGIAFGTAALIEDGAGLDVVMAATLVLWAVYAGLLLLRSRARLRGQRVARALLAGFPLAVLTLALTHFA
jgi:ABC-type uncharacterized transport system permease subunit